MSRKIKVPKEETGYGYVGVWSNGKLGWGTPHHLSPSRKYPENSYAAEVVDKTADRGERTYLCRITVTPILDKKSRPITKIYGDHGSIRGF